MSKANPHFTLMAAWRVMPATDRWQTYQSLLSRGNTPGSHPWTRRSTVLCSWRALAVRASAARP